MSGPAPLVLPLGETAWTVVLGDTVDRELHARVTALAARIAGAGLAGVVEIVPAYAVVTVFFDPLEVDAEVIRAHLSELATETDRLTVLLVSSQSPCATTAPTSRTSPPTPGCPGTR